MKLGLVPKIIIAIIIGILIGQYLPEDICRTVVTLSGIFSNFLKFVIPLMILAYVTMGIADLSQGAGKLLLITAVIAYGSTLVGGTFSFTVADTLFPSFISAGVLDELAKTAGKSLPPFFSITIPPILDTISAVVLAFIIGLCLSSLRGKEIGDTLYNGFKDFSKIIDQVLTHAIVPFLPLYICGTFVDMTRSGKTFVILSVLWKVFLVVIAMHLILLFVQFMIAGSFSGKNPFTLMKNQIPGYTTALGTQSSAATIPVNLECSKADGVCEQIRNFVIPLCANIHMCGSMITITACATAVCLMYQIPIHLGTVIPLHYDPGRCHGGFSGCSRRIHHDGPALPVDDLRERTGRPQWSHLRPDGGPVHYPGFLRDCLQRIRGQRHCGDCGQDLQNLDQKIISAKSVPSPSDPHLQLSA